jgi:ADP-heptose:LPS heptosyltransferase
MPHRCLVVKPSSFGDIIHGLQVIQSLKQDLKEEIQITWIVRDLFAPFVRCCSTVDEILVFNRGEGLRGMIRLLSKIRRGSYDSVIDLQGLLRSGIMTAAAKSSRKIGRTDSREGASFFYNEKIIPCSRAESHAIEKLINIKFCFGLKNQLSSKLEFKKVDLCGFPDLKNKKIIVIYPESRRKEKEWNQFIPLTIDLLKKNYFVVWAGVNKKEFPEQHASFLNLTNALSIDQLPTLMNQSDLVIANDSGPMHLAAAMNLSVLSLFGPTDPKMYGPYPSESKRNHVIQSPSNCMKDIRLEEVFLKVTQILSSSPF